MKIISFGNLEYNYYLKDDILKYLSIGSSSLFTLTNLSKVYDTLYLYNGVDEYHLLDDLSIKSIKLMDNTNKVIFRENNNYTSICPYCNRLYKYNYLPITNIDKYIDEEDHLIVDNINEDTLNILSSLNNNAYLLLKYVSSINNISYNELITNLTNKFKIIALSKKVYDYLRSKFKIDDVDLYNELKCELLIIFYDSKGCTLIYNDNIVEKELDEFSIVDSYGGFEAFVSSFISSYITNQKFDDKIISSAYINGINNYMRCISLVGGLTYLCKMKNVEKYTGCICEKISLKQ